MGSESNIPYRELFDAYKNILITNSRNDDPITGELYRYYNSIVFYWEADWTRKSKAVHDDSEDEPQYSSGVEDAIRPIPSQTVGAKQFQDNAVYSRDGAGIEEAVRLPVSNDSVLIWYLLLTEKSFKIREMCLAWSRNLPKKWD